METNRESIAKRRRSQRANRNWKELVLILVISVSIITGILFIMPSSRNVILNQFNAFYSQASESSAFMELYGFVTYNTGYAQDTFKDIQSEGLSNDDVKAEGSVTQADAAEQGSITIADYANGDNGYKTVSAFTDESGVEQAKSTGDVPASSIGDKPETGLGGYESPGDRLIINQDIINAGDLGGLLAVADLSAMTELGGGINKTDSVRGDIGLNQTDFVEGGTGFNRTDSIGSGIGLNQTGIVQSSDRRNQTDNIEEAPPVVDDGYNSYEDLFPDLYTFRSRLWATREKTVFLTFDDGPTIYTETILNVLKEKNVRGTFFIVGHSVGKLKNGDEILNRMVNEGHTIAIHCNYHGYDGLYKSVEAYLEDFNKVYELIYEKTGVHADIFRFPGGSTTRYNKSIRSALINEMERRGFTYYDWNASTGDTASNSTAETAYQNAVAKSGTSKRLIILMHDTKKVSVDALPRIIDRYKELGFSLDRLYNDDKPVVL